MHVQIALLSVQVAAHDDGAFTRCTSYSFKNRPDSCSIRRSDKFDLVHKNCTGDVDNTGIGLTQLDAVPVVGDY